MISVVKSMTWGKRTKVLKCPRCGLRFANGYAKAYHEKNAARLCPKMRVNQQLRNIGEIT